MEKKKKKKNNNSKKMKSNKKLMIVESPAKIKTISKFLGENFQIMSTFGHVKDLPPKKLGVTVDEQGKISIEYSVIENKNKLIKDICKTASKSKEIYLASDPDREGEIISWHISQEIEKIFPDKSKIYRITFNEITKPAITNAIEHKTIIDLNKVNAQQARRVLDRWVGYEVSPILWRKIAKGLSAGRVQSVALLLICNREEEVLIFKPDEYWSVQALFIFKKTTIESELFKISNKTFKLKNKQETDKVLGEIKKEKFSVEKITEKKRFKRPLPPFMTSTLQQDSYNKLGFSVDKTMSVAQKLYEGVSFGDKDKQEALITYMRTDSLRISNTAIKDSRNYISKKFGSDYLPKATNVYTKKGAQDAHEAIRPINVGITPQIASRHLTPDQTKLYSLIWKRFVACQMAPAQYFQRQLLIKGKKYTFKTTGSTLMFDGFLKVYMVETEEDKQTIKIPKEIKEKDSLPLKKVDGKQHFTQPPSRYSQATLVKELEKKGVGRPSTYAAILSTIQKRKYAKFEKKRFHPTELGKTVNNMLIKNLPDIINISFTAHMEEDLDKIEAGKIKRDSVLNEFYEKFKKDLVAFGGKIATKKALETKLKCPKCGKSLMIRFGKTGEFLGCSKFPECKFTSNFKRDEKGEIHMVKEEVKETEIKCPKCGKMLVKKIGRFGPFYACPGYPECKYIHQESLKMPCPQCGEKIVKRRWKGGNFWGCSGYPKCQFAIFGEVEETPCPKCNSPYLLIKKDKQKNIIFSCPNKECDYTKKD